MTDLIYDITWGRKLMRFNFKLTKSEEKKECVGQKTKLILLNDQEKYVGINDEKIKNIVFHPLSKNVVGKEIGNRKRKSLT